MSENNFNTSGEQLSAGMVIAVLQDVGRRISAVIAAALIAAMLAFVFVDYTYQPLYRTSATFVVSSSSATSTSYTNLSAANTTASVFSEVLNSSILRKKVQQEAGIPYFDGKIEARVLGDTNLLTVTVTGQDPRSVFLMCKGVIKHHHIVSRQALSGVVLEVLDAPYAPATPVNQKNLEKSVLKRAVAAAAVMAGALAVMSYISDKVRSRSEADSKLGCHILGEFYHERKYRTIRSRIGKKKKSILITNPLTSFVYTESVHKLASRVDKHRHKGQHVIMVTSVLENEGKSTVAANLAISMAQKGKKVLLMDCDLRKPSCDLIFDVKEYGSGTAEVLRGTAKLEDAVKYLKANGIYLLSGSKSLKTATELLNSPAMENLLEQARQLYDMIIIDVPPMAVAPDAENICEFADASLLVVRQNAATADAINDAAEVLDKAGHLLGCVLNNMYGAGNFTPVHRYGAYGRYGGYGRYGHYGKYGRYGKYGYGKNIYKADNSEENKR